MVVAYKGAFHYGLASSYSDIDDRVQTWLQWGVPAAVETILALGAGRTFGELTVSVRAVARRRSLTPISRVVKLAVGVGPFLALGVLTPAWSTLGAGRLPRRHRPGRAAHP